MRTLHACGTLVVAIWLLLPGVGSGQATDQAGAQTLVPDIGETMAAAQQAGQVPELIRLAGEQARLEDAIHEHSGQFASRNDRLEDVNRELAINATERERLDRLRENADRLRREIRGEAAQADSTAASAAEEEGYLGQLSRWFGGKYSDPGGDEGAGRRRNQVDETLRSQGLSFEIDGEQQTEHFASLAQLEAVLAEETGAVQQAQERIEKDRQAAVTELENYNIETERLQGELDKVNADIGAETQRVRHADLINHGRYGELTEAVEDEVKSPSPIELQLSREQKIELVRRYFSGMAMNGEIGFNRPSDPRDREQLNEIMEEMGSAFFVPPEVAYGPLIEGITDEIRSASTEAAAPQASAGAFGGPGAQLLQNLDSDLMTHQEYDERMEQRAQENQPGPVIDEAIRRQAESIDQQLAAAEQRYQELIRQNAQAEEIRRAWAQQEAIRSQWIQQQYLQQNFSQAVQQAFGGSRFTPPNSSPVITRFGGSSTPTPSRSQGGVGTGRRGGNAAGIKGQFSPVTDPNKAQQYQQTFGNRNKR